MTIANMTKSATLRGFGHGAAWVAFLALLALPATVTSQEARVTGSSISISSQPGGSAALDLDFDDGAGHAIELDGGVIRVDGREVGSYTIGGELETAWRDFLRGEAGREANGLGKRLFEWLRDWLEDWDQPNRERSGIENAVTLQAEIDRILAVTPSTDTGTETATVTGPGGSRLTIAPGGLGFDALSRQLEQLNGRLLELGDAGAGADQKLALIVHADHSISEGETVAGNLAIVGGSLSLAGQVRGDVLVLDGTLVLEPSGRIEGNVLQVGGELESLGGAVAGELLAIRPVAPAERVEVTVQAAPSPRAQAQERPPRRPRGFFDRVGNNVSRAISGLVGILGLLAGLSILGMITVYFARPQLETVADTVRSQFGRSFALGLAGQVLFWPILLILVVLVITWPVVPFFLLATALALAIGYLAVAHVAGEMFAQRRYRYEWLERIRRSNSFYYVISGLVLLLSPFAIAAALWLLGGLTGFLRGLLEFAACLATWILVTTGFGATLLTRAGTRREEVAFDDWEMAPVDPPAEAPVDSPAEDAVDPPAEDAAQPESEPVEPEQAPEPEDEKPDA